jgi:hypothetical protein
MAPELFGVHAESNPTRRVAMPGVSVNGPGSVPGPVIRAKVSTGGGTSRNIRIMPCMDNNQTRVIELLREVHLIALKELERLNLRIAELENQPRPPVETKLIVQQPASPPPPAKEPATEMMTDIQLSDFTKTPPPPAPRSAAARICLVRL